MYNTSERSSRRKGGDIAVSVTSTPSQTVFSWGFRAAVTKVFGISPKRKLALSRTPIYVRGIGGKNEISLALRDEQEESVALGVPRT